MENNTFEPDYAKWWKKKNITKEQIIWLMHGVNPDDVKRETELSQENDKSSEEQQWLGAFRNYCYQRDPFLRRNFKQYNDLLDWKENKKQLVTAAYEACLKISETFLEHLIQIKDFKRNKNLEKFSENSKYGLNYDSLNINDIVTAEAGFAVLLGLEPTHFANFVKLAKRANERLEDNTSYVAYIHLLPKEKWQYTFYRKFLNERFSYLHFMMFPAEFILSILNKSKKLCAWTSDFPTYFQSLHDEGFIFPADAYAALNKKNISVEYSQDAWAVRFYKRWLKECVWSLPEALSLFSGKDPRKNMRGYEDLGQNPHVINPWIDETSAWDTYDGDLFAVEPRLSKYVAASLIRVIELKEQNYYIPEEITLWLIDHIPYNPPQALVEIVLSNDQIADYAASKPARMKEIREVSRKIQSTNRRSNELHELIGKTIVDLGYKGKQAPASEVWKHIQDNQDDLELIQEITTSEIQWVSYRGTEQRMRRERFNTVISEYNTGKKTYP